MKINQDVNRILQTPDVRERLVSQGAEPLGGTPEQFADYVKAEIGKWSKVVAAFGARVD